MSYLSLSRERCPCQRGTSSTQVSPHRVRAPSPLHPAESEDPTCANASFGGSPFEWFEGRAHWGRRDFIKGIIASGVAVSGVPYLASAASRPGLQAGAVERLISLNVNGQTRRVDVLPNETLAMTLRYKLGPHRYQARL